MDLVIYHKDCPDGWCAAFVAQKRYPGVQLLGLDHGAPPPYEAVSGKDVLVVDFSWRTKEINRELNERAKSFQILDHHKSAFETLSGEPYATFDMDRSGAGLTFDTLFGEYAGRPWYVDYVEDHDLWRHKLYESRTVSAYVMTLPHTVEAWNALDHTDIEEAIRFGQGASLQIKHYVEKAVGQRRRGVLQGHHGYRGPRACEIVNAPYMNCSEVGEALAEFAPIGLTWFERGDGMIQFSLRSKDEVDVSAIAKLYGGGGHLHAAGFQLPYKEGRDVIDSALYRDFV